MANSLLEDFKTHFIRQRNPMTTIILINVGVFILLRLAKTFFVLSGVEGSFFSNIVYFLSLPASFENLITQPWTLFTYMFVHVDFMHILFNMLWLYWMGRIFMDFLSKDKFTVVYILGGIVGGLLYMVLYNIFPVFREGIQSSYLIGASAGVLAIAIATATLVPQYTIHLLFFGPVKLMYLAIIMVVLDIISIGAFNPGGHIAHLGGALLGFIYIKQLRKGNDIGLVFTKFFSGLRNYFKKKDDLKVSHRAKEAPPRKKKMPSGKEVSQERIDEILDKISESGYSSLTDEEKQILFKASDKK